MPQTDVLSPRVTRLLQQFPGPATVHVARWKIALLFAPNAILTAYLIYLLWPYWPRIIRVESMAVFWGLAMIVLPWALSIAAVAVVFFKDIPRIALDADGVALHSLFGVRRSQWKNVSNFVSRLVYTSFSDAVDRAGFWDRINRYGGRIFFRGVYELSARDLAQLMTAWRERALAAPR